jgi:hypothetical protein
VRNVGLVACDLRCRLSWLHNRWSDKTISVKDSIVVWWAGMMRGAVSVAMVYYRFDPNNEADDKHAATIVVTTLQLVLYSTVGLGGLTGPLLKYLLPRQVCISPLCSPHRSPFDITLPAESQQYLSAPFSHSTCPICCMCSPQCPAVLRRLANN